MVICPLSLINCGGFRVTPKRFLICETNAIQLVWSVAECITKHRFRSTSAVRPSPIRTLTAPSWRRSSVAAIPDIGGKKATQSTFSRAPSTAFLARVFLGGFAPARQEGVLGSAALPEAVTKTFYFFCVFASITYVFSAIGSRTLA